VVRSYAVAALALVFACTGDDDGPDTAAGSESGSTGAMTTASSTNASTSTGATTTTSGPAESSSGADSSGGEASSGSSSTGEAGLVPMFVAQGMLGRSTISCDDGMSWVADRSWDQEGDPLLCGSTDPVRCDQTACSYMDITGECSVSDPCDCGHNPGFAKGVAYGNGYFVATWGWGHPGSIRRTKNGIDWEETLSGEDAMFGGLVFGADTFVLSSRYPYHSNDGSGWIAGEEADFRGPMGEIVWSVRRLGFIDYDGGRFVATANPPEDVLITKDLGQTWVSPTSIDDACLSSVGSYGGIASNDTVIVGVGDDARPMAATRGRSAASAAKASTRACSGPARSSSRGHRACATRAPTARRGRRRR
jgi:hypothetical protein